MVGHVGLHRPNDAQVVDVLGEAREDFADLDARLAVLLKLEWRGEGCPGFSLGREVEGIALPAYFCREGLGSNVSTCDGPPFMNRKMTLLALAAIGGFRGAMGL